MIRRLLPLAAVCLLAACKGKQATTTAPQAASAERRTITVDASATGVVEPINVVEVKSKASGMITRMPVETGTNVNPGDLLVQVDTRDVQNQYDQSAADVKAAEAKLEVSSAQKKRADDLFASRVTTAQEHESAALDYANAQAQVVRARTNLDLAKQRLEDATVTAPVSGTVIEKTVSLGQVITSATGAFGGGTTLLKMADLGRVRVRALFNETDIGQVGPGQVVTVTVDAYPERRFQGVVEKIEPQAVVQQGVTLFPVLVTLDNREGLLKPGMNGEASVLVDERQGVLAVPNDAVRSPREAAATAPLLGLNADTVQAVVRTQLASARGGMGGGFGGGFGGGEGAVQAGSAPARGGQPPVSRTSATTPAQQAPAGGARQGNGGGNFGGGFDGELPSDADCQKVTASLQKTGAQQKLDALRAKVQSGELDFQAVREESRKIYEAAGVDSRTAMGCRRKERMANGGGNGGGNFGGGNMGATGGRRGADGNGAAVRPADASQARVGQAPTSAAPTRRTRPQPRLVFVQKIAAKDTTWEPRVIMVGVSNYDYTEVLSGLKEGEQVAMLASAALQAQRQAQNDRFRQGMGGVPGMSQNQQPGGGGQRGPGGGGPGGGGGGGGGAPRRGQ